MSRSTKALVGVAVVAGLSVGGYFLFRKAQEKKLAVDETVSSVQSQLDELDPVSRAAVVAKLSSDQVKGLRGGRA